MNYKKRRRGGVKNKQTNKQEAPESRRKHSGPTQLAIAWWRLTKVRGEEPTISSYFTVVPEALVI